MIISSLLQPVTAGLILTFLGWFGLKAKKIRARIVAIWNSPTKNRNGVSQSQFDEFRDEMRKLMRPIQPDSNGGKSLPDAIGLMQEVRDDIKEIKSRQTFIGDVAVATKAAVDLHIATKNAHTY